MMTAPSPLPDYATQFATALAAPSDLADQVQRWLAFRGLATGEWIELQALDVEEGTGSYTATRCAYANDAATLARLYQEGDRFRCPGVYTIANRIDDAVASRQTPGRWFTTKKGRSTTDRDVTHRRVIFVDVDYERPTGTAATDAQVEEAHRVASRCYADLDALLPPGALAFGHSGNGRSIFIALACLPATTELGAMVKGVLAALKERHETATVKIDPSVSDEKRLAPAFGTMKRKGNGQGDRPHRRTVLVTPPSPRPLSFAEVGDLLAALRRGLDVDAIARVDKAMGVRPVQAAPARPSPAGDAYRAIYQEAKEIPVGEVLAWLGLLQGSDPVCPGCGKSGDSSVAIYMNGLKCLHKSCAERGVAGSPGFRTVIDIVCEAQGVEPRDAVNALAERFGTPALPEPAPARVYQLHTPAARAPAVLTPPDLAGDIAGLLAQLAALPAEQRAAAAMSPALVQAAAAMADTSAEFVQLRADVKEAGATMGAWDKAVKAARPAAPAKPTPAPYRKAKQAEEGDTRPEIIVDDDALHKVVAQGVEALLSRPDIYERDGALVHVVRVEEENKGLPKGSPAIKQMAASTLRVRLAESARWIKPGRKGDVSVIPSDSVVLGILNQGEWRPMRRLVGVIEAPAPRPDGTLIEEPGYDEATGYLYAPNAAFERVPEVPTQRDAALALAELGEVFVDFPYAKEVHRYVPIAALLTILARPAIQGACPAFLFDAATRGSGKTLQSDAVGLIASGRTTAKMSYPMQEDELEKVLGAYALRGASVINFDNVTRTFGGGPIDRCLTAEDTVELRILGKSEVPEIRWRAIIIATGGNIILCGDTARRVVVGRLESPLENPENRTDFKHKDLLAWVRENRTRLVRAALTVLRAWHVADRPEGDCKGWGGFGPWAAMIPPAIVYAGGENVLDARPSAGTDGEDPEKAALAVILRDLAPLAGVAGITARSIVGLLYTRERMRGEMAPDGLDDFRDAIETLVPTKPGFPPDPAHLGRALSKVKGRVIGGKRIIGKLPPAGGGTVRWSVG